MKNKAFMSIVLLTFVTVGAVFAQSPTLDKLKFAQSGNYFQATPINNQISGAVVIPATYDNKKVTGTGGFQNNKNITSVTIPDGINIAYSAFLGCDKLTSVTFQGKDIYMADGLTASFTGDLAAKYKAGGAGTYTRPAGGTVWTKQVAAVNTSLDGWWIGNGGLTIYIDGNTGYIVHFGTTPVWLDAQKKDYVKTNDQKMRNIRSTGNLTWTMQELYVNSNTRSPNVATGTSWGNRTLTMSADGQTLSENGSVIYTRTLAFQQKAGKAPKSNRWVTDT